MKKIRKALLPVVACLLAALLLASCAQTEQNTVLPDTEETAETAETAETGANTADVTETATAAETTPSVETPDPTEPPVDTPTPTPAPTLTPYSDPDFGPLPAGVGTEVMTEEDLHKGALLLINSEHPYDPAKVTGLVNAFEQSRKVAFKDYLRFMNTGLMANADLVTALQRLQHAMRVETGTNKDLVLRASYMTAAEIEKARDDAKYAFCPGDDPTGSEHGAGLSANVAFIGNGLTYRLYDGGAGSESNYVKLNAARFGLITRYTKIKSSVTGHEEEKDHLRYVGIPHALYMEAHGLCLEEYLEALKAYTPDERLTVTDRDGYVWSIYYVAASGTGKTEVPVPGGVVYSISGNNYDGFIVTVKAAWDGALSGDDAPTASPTPETAETPAE
ncbi:MAG: D-alanyl-D-alanine carboxypeptidase family protein [Clostridia bacterium]|nr:D-alanyl-D-alanine carboxypeptidase family protein [Clostridia bacterium]